MRCETKTTGKTQAEYAGKRTEEEVRSGRGWVEVAVVRRTLRRLRDSSGCEKQGQPGMEQAAGQRKARFKGKVGLHKRTRRLGG